MKTALVLGGGGNVGTRIVERLKDGGVWVRAVDVKYPEQTKADEFVIGDLKDVSVVSRVMFAPKQRTLGSDPDSFDEVYMLAHTEGDSAESVYNNTLVNMHCAYDAVVKGVKKIFFPIRECTPNVFTQGFLKILKDNKNVDIVITDIK